MLLLAILTSICFGFAFGQTSCGALPTTSEFTPIVMRYTPAMSPQIGPTSTIWDMIVTTWYNALDCRYVTPLRVDENPAPEGPFTTFVRSPTLTITRVGCMPETTAVTRRDVRAQNQYELRTATLGQEHKLQKRRTTQEAIDEIANDMPITFPPNIGDLTVQAYRFLVSCNTALFAINLVQAGLDLNSTCANLRDPVTQARLFRTTIDPVQAGDIVCFAASSGLYFGVPTSQIVTYLQDLIYAIQVRASYPDDSQDFCWPLEIANSPFLGIDTNGISQYLCPSGNIPTLSSITSSISPTQSATSTEIGTITGTGSILPSVTGPYGNSTAAESTTTPIYTANSTSIIEPPPPPPMPNSTLSTSVIPPTANTTEAVSTIRPPGTAGTAGSVGTVWTYSSGIIFPNATHSEVGTGTGTAGTVASTGNLPPTPTAVSPEIQSVTPTPPRRFLRW